MRKPTKLEYGQRWREPKRPSVRYSATFQFEGERGTGVDRFGWGGPVGTVGLHQRWHHGTDRKWLPEDVILRDWTYVGRTMTAEQFRLCIDFSKRMALNGGYRNTPRRLREEVATETENFWRWNNDEDRPPLWTAWDDGCGDEVSRYLWDAMWNYRGTEAEFERWRERPMQTLFVCSIRSAIDMVVAPSAGVAGFTVGDLRRMYPDGIPAWFPDDWKDSRGKHRPLAKMKDSEGIWL